MCSSRYQHKYSVLWEGAKEYVGVQFVVHRGSSWVAAQRHAKTYAKSKRLRANRWYKTVEGNKILIKRECVKFERSTNSNACSRSSEGRPVTSGLP